MEEVSNVEVESHLKQLQLLSVLYDSATTRAEQAALSVDFVRVCKWLEERGVPFQYDGFERRWKRVERE